MKTLALILVVLSLAGCTTASQTVTRIVEVPSSKPYRFIKWSTRDSPETKRDIRAHNRAHQAVIDSEKAKAR
jgi:hypothetical protein